MLAASLLQIFDFARSGVTGLCLIKQVRSSSFILKN